MPRQFNPYYGDPTWAAAAQNLAGIIRPDPTRAAQLEAYLTQARSQQQTDDFARRDRHHRYNAADAFVGDDNLAGMGHLMRGGNLDHLGAANMAFGGEHLAQGAATEDMQRARMSGAGIQPNAGLALSQGTADTLRAQDAERDLAQALGVQGLRNQGGMALAQHAYDNPTNAEHAMLHGGVDPAVVHRHMNPLSADQTLAADLGGDPDRLGHVRYGHGPEADASNPGGSPLSLEQALVRHIQDDPEALGGLYQMRHGPAAERGPGIGDVARFDSTVMGLLDAEFPEVPFEMRAAVASAVSDLARADIEQGQSPHFPTLINRVLTEQFEATPATSRWFSSTPANIQPRQPQGMSQGAPQGAPQMGGVDPNDPLGIRRGPGS